MTSKIGAEVTPLTKDNIKSARFIANADGRLGFFSPDDAEDFFPWHILEGEREDPQREWLGRHEVLGEEGWYVISVPDLPKPMTAEQKLSKVYFFSEDVVSKLVALGLADLALKRVEDGFKNE